MDRADDDPAPQEHECLLCFLRRVVAAHGCAHDLAWTERYRSVRVPAATGLAQRLAAVGATCDCTALSRGWWPVREIWQRDLHTDELTPPTPWPGCEAVGATSARPCRRWVRRTRWDP